MEPPQVMQLKYKELDLPEITLQHDNVWIWLFYVSIVAMLIYILFK
jgi:hypothetical protein